MELDSDESLSEDTSMDNSVSSYTSNDAVVISTRNIK